VETSISDPADVRWRLENIRQKARESGRDPASIETHLYHNINVNDDRHRARRVPAVPPRVLPDGHGRAGEDWTATGSPEQCIEHLRVYKQMGISEVALRITAWTSGASFARDGGSTPVV